MKNSTLRVREKVQLEEGSLRSIGIKGESDTELPEMLREGLWSKTKRQMIGGESQVQCVRAHMVWAGVRDAKEEH